MHLLEKSGKFYYIEVDSTGRLLSANTCFYNDVFLSENHQQAGSTTACLPDFVEKNGAETLQLKLSWLWQQPSGTRFDMHFRLYYSPGSTHYILTDWEFCREENGLVGIGSKAVEESYEHPLAPAQPSSRDLFEVFLNKSQNIVFIKDTQGAYLSASPAFYRYFGLSEAEVIGRYDHEVLDKLLGGQCERSDAETLQKGLTTFGIEYDQQGRQYEVTKFPFTLSDGTPVIGGIMRETTRQFRMDTRLRYIAEQVPGVLFEFHQRTASRPDTPAGFPGQKLRNRYNYISPKIYEYTGYTPEEIFDDNIIPYSLIHKDDRRKVRQALARAARELQTSEIEYRSYHRHQSGMRWARSVSKPVQQPDGSVIWYGIVTDITSVKEKEAALRGAEQRFHLVAENISDGILVFNEDKRIIYVSASFGTQFHLTPERLLGSDINDILAFIYPDDRQRIYDYVMKHLQQQEEHFQYEYRIIAADGNLLWREDSTSVIYDANGNLHRAYVIARDITRRKQMEEELRSSLDLLTSQNHRLTSFTHIVSHNLRSHVSNILGLLSLTGPEAGPGEVEEVMKLLKTPAQKLDETLHHLNEIVSIQSNMRRKQSKVELRPHIEKNLDIIRGSLESSYAKVEVSVPGGFWVSCIPSYLDNILLNLFTNAVKYRDPERRLYLRIDASETSEFHCISVTDNGLGIDLERYKNRLFGMYKTFHDNPDARGIGLFITKNQVEAMGGYIEVSSRTGENSGSSFSVHLRKKPLQPE